MSDQPTTPTNGIDMNKVTQMLDAGWDVHVWKNEMGSYSVKAKPPSQVVRNRVERLLRDGHENVPGQQVAYDKTYDWDYGWLITDGFTAAEALTRMAYKVHGEVI